MPTIPLPANPSLVQLRKRARELQRRIRSGSESALLAEFYPDAKTPVGEFPLNLAQLVVARQYGFVSWQRLLHHVGAVSELARKPDLDSGFTDPTDVFLTRAVLRYGGDEPARWARAEQLLAADPSLAQRSIYTAAAAADHAAVQQFLTQAPESAHLQGGPFDWEPLLYLTYSRLPMSLGDTLTTAGLLLQAGADPNAGYLWHGYPTPFTALTGAFGQGEGGKENQPAHPHSVPLARLLLSAGADANDGQSLYNRMFEPANDHLELLFDYGLGTGDGGPWRTRLPETTDSPERLLSIQLGWAVGHGMQKRIALLAEKGVDLNQKLDTPYLSPITPLELAGITGQTDTVGLLLALGAVPDESDPDLALVTALMSGDQPTVDRLAGGLERVRRRHPALVLRATVINKPDVVKLLVSNGFDVNAYGRSDGPKDEAWETALHHAAFQGKPAMARLLLELGADKALRDKRFDGTPLDWAMHGQQPELIALLGAPTP